jgi:RsiW-degrading membrane proteinase PrsW (M82 family)
MFLAIAPGFAIMLYIYLKDRYEPEPLGLLLKCFVLGALSTLPAIALELYGSKIPLAKGTSDWHQFVSAYFVVAFSEEFCKYAIIYWFAYRNPHFDEPFDGIVYSVMVGMGFATLENIMYVADGNLSTAFMRMFTAVPAHATFAIIMGFFLGKAKFHPAEAVRYHLYALGGAMVFHGTYDYSLFEIKNYPIAFVGALASLIIGIRLSRKAIQLSSDESPFKVQV